MSTLYCPPSRHLRPALPAHVGLARKCAALCHPESSSTVTTRCGISNESLLSEGRSGMSRGGGWAVSAWGRAGT
eukprot:3895711-Rhodomonas_salina.1